MAGAGAALRKVHRSASRLFVVALFVCLASSPASGQTVAGGSEVWSPLSPAAELPRIEPVIDVKRTDLLGERYPRIGLFWFASNPAALAREVSESRAEFQVGLLNVDGAYHRPLDVGRKSHKVASGYAWGPLGASGAGIGRVAVDRLGFRDGVYSDVLQPYTTEPYSVLDTLGEATAGTNVLVEGAGGWSIGRIAFGLALGHGANDIRTVESAVPRVMTFSNTGVSAGVTLELLSDRVWFGPVGTVQQTVESANIYSVAATSRVYALAGYHDPLQIDLTGGLFSRRFERSAWSGGIGVQAKLAGAAWVGYAQREHRSATNYDKSTLNAPEDKWSAEGWSGGAVVQFWMFERTFVTLNGRYTTVTGEAEQPDIEGVPFSSRESQLTLAADVRYQLGPATETAFRIGATRANRSRNDALLEVSSSVVTWRPTASLELLRWLSPKFAVSLSGATMEHNPSGSVPSTSLMGPVYQNWVAPELEYEATASRSWVTAGTVHLQARPGTAFWFTGEYAHTSPQQHGVGWLPYAPTGDRRATRLIFGVTLGER